MFGSVVVDARRVRYFSVEARVREVTVGLSKGVMGFWVWALAAVSFKCGGQLDPTDRTLLECI